MATSTIDKITGVHAAVSTGFVDFNATNPAQTLTVNQWNTVLNNTLGPNTLRSFQPAGVAMSVSGEGVIDISSLSIGDVVIIRPDLFITPSVNNTAVWVRLKLGQAGGEYFLEKPLPRLVQGSHQYHLALDSYLIYVGNESTRLGGITLQVKADEACTLLNNGIVLAVHHTTNRGA